MTGAVTKWQCAAFITWRVSPVTRPFMATRRPLSDIAKMRTHYNIVRTLTELVPSTANPSQRAALVVIGKPGVDEGTFC